MAGVEYVTDVCKVHGQGKSTGMTAERRLLAIVSGDVAGYSRLMSADEDATIAAVSAARELTGSRVVAHNGRLVDFTGDNFLAEFSSANHAAAFALSLQRSMATQESGDPHSSRLKFRLGLHVGDVRVDGARLYGDGINIAARLESLAEPGGICLSASVLELTAANLGLSPQPMGPQALKGIARPVTAFLITESSLLQTPDEPAQTGSQQHQADNIVTSTVPVIAVLPLKCLSPDSGHQQLADGITADVITGLSCDQRLSVIAAGSTARYQDSDETLETIGQKLGADHLAEGSLRFAGNRVRVAIALVQAASGVELWGTKRDFELDDLFQAIDDIVEAMVIAIASHLRLAENTRHLRQRPSGLTPWTLAGEAFRLFARNPVTPLEESLELAEAAVAADPDYAFAWAVLGFMTAFKYPMGRSADRDADMRASLDHTAQALMLDPNDPMALTARAIALQYAGRPGESLEFLQRSLRLNPSDTLTHCYYGRGMMFSGKPDIALAHFERFGRLNPDDPTAHMATMYHALALMFMQRWEECESVARIGNVLAGERNGWILVTLLITLTAQERMADAQSMLARVNEVVPHWTREFVTGFFAECQADPALTAPVVQLIDRVWQ